MRFLKGDQHPRWRRGRARKQYRLSDAALRARRRNLGKVRRLRSMREIATIKLLIWQSCFESGQRPSQRSLARQVGVWPSYVHKVMRRATSDGMDAIQRGARVTLGDLNEARRFTAKLREQEPGLLASLGIRRSLSKRG